MASLTKDAKSGTRRVQFTGLDKKRQTVYLPGVTLAEARTIKARIESLLSAAHAKLEWSPDLAKWVGSVSDSMAEKLAKVKLIPPRTKPAGDQTEPAEMLGNVLDAYIGGRANLKPNTRRNYEVTKKHLLDFFGEGRKVASIVPGDADDFRESLRRKLAAATVSREIKRAKQFFKVAVRKRLIAENPFDGMATPAQVNSSRGFDVTPEMTARILDACPDAEWRLIVAMARYGGLRTPSETLALTWDCVDWERGRLTVKSPKTEHIEGRDSRVIPLWPELKPHLEAVFDEAEPGTAHVINRYRDSRANLRTQLCRIIRRAGLEPWPKVFHNMRASRETELTARFPLHVVCEWIGNTATIADKHYLRVTERDFEAAVREHGTTEKPATHFTTQSAQIRTLQESPKKQQTLDFPEENEGCYMVTIGKTPPRGVERWAETPGNTASGPSGNAFHNVIRAENGSEDAGLRVVVEAWEHLDQDDRKAILTIIRQAAGAVR